MGETADKMNRDDAHKRVAELRDEITRKRDQLSVELEELRRRRTDVIVRGKETAKMAACAAVGMWVIGSLVNAVLDIFRKDDDSSEEIDDSELLTTTSSAKKVAKKEARSSAVLSALTTIVVNEIRKAAINYAKQELRSRMTQSQARVASRQYGGNGNGTRKTDVA